MLYETYVCGTDRWGKVYPRHHLYAVGSVQIVVNEYRFMYPEVVHVNVDIAIPMADSIGGTNGPEIGYRD